MGSVLDGEKTRGHSATYKTIVLFVMAILAPALHAGKRPGFSGEAQCRCRMGPRDKPEGDNWNGRLRWCDDRKRFVDIVRLGPGGQRCAWERCAKPGYVCWTGDRKSVV